jgi:hypothetical protein
MEESQNQSQEVPQENFQSQGNGVSFPTVGGEKKSGGAKTLLIVGILILVGVLGYVIYRSASGKSEETTLTEPTPYVNMAAPVETSTPSTVPTSSPSATTKPVTANKTNIKIQVQNGTGITGEAAFLQNILKGLGYTNVTVGNSATQDATDTEVSFASTLSSDVVSEITTKLNSTYQTVVKAASTSTTYDVVIVTGLQKGATPKPTATPTANP